MIVDNLSPCFATKKIKETKDFYINFFDAKVTFDCGWYVNLEFGKEASQLQFMNPEKLGKSTCNPSGLTYNFNVKDVDGEYEKLTSKGLNPTMPLEDHAWGDRAFAVQDPNGITLYIYSDREPGEEFKEFFK